jgi:hypothetical protein
VFPFDKKDIIYVIPVDTSGQVYKGVGGTIVQQKMMDLFSIPFANNCISPGMYEESKSYRFINVEYAEDITQTGELVISPSYDTTRNTPHLYIYPQQVIRYFSPCCEESVVPDVTLFSSVLEQPERVGKRDMYYYACRVNQTLVRAFENAKVTTVQECLVFARAGLFSSLVQLEGYLGGLDKELEELYIKEQKTGRAFRDASTFFDLFCDWFRINRCYSNSKLRQYVPDSVWLSNWRYTEILITIDFQHAYDLYQKNNRPFRIFDFIAHLGLGNMHYRQALPYREIYDSPEFWIYQSHYHSFNTINWGITMSRAGVFTDSQGVKTTREFRYVMHPKLLKFMLQDTIKDQTVSILGNSQVRLIDAPTEAEPSWSLSHESKIDRFFIALQYADIWPLRKCERFGANVYKNLEYIPDGYTLSTLRESNKKIARSYLFNNCFPSACIFSTFLFFLLSLVFIANVE